MATIEVQEVPVLVDTLVLKGDTILLFNGMVIGSHERRDIPKASNEVPVVVKSPSFGHRGATSSKNAALITREAVSDALFKMGAGSTLEIGDYLQLKRADTLGRGKIGRVIRYLLKIKVVEPVPTDRLRQDVYKLAAVNAKRSSD